LVGLIVVAVGVVVEEVVKNDAEAMVVAEMDDELDFGGEIRRDGRGGTGRGGG